MTIGVRWSSTLWCDMRSYVGDALPRARDYLSRHPRLLTRLEEVGGDRNLPALADIDIDYALAVISPWFRELIRCHLDTGDPELCLERQLSPEKLRELDAMILVELMDL